MDEEIPVMTSAESKTSLAAGEDQVFMDVRKDYGLAGGKIPPAVPIRLDDIPARFLSEDSARDYVMVCHSGQCSALATAYLLEGYRVRNLEGGTLQRTGTIE